MVRRRNFEFEEDPLITRILDPVGIETPLEKLLHRNYWYWRKCVMPRIEQRGKRGCWIWDGGTQKVGKYYYPVINVPKSMTANLGTKKMHVVQFIARMFWRYPEEYVVYHKCFIRECVNPNHFWLGERGLTDYKD